tara:strand:- start:3024 stop:4595 length:1572 start_codon:yes stop_codon:yes gene_type:complete
MSKTIQKFIETLGWKVNDYSWDGHSHLFYVDEPEDIDVQFENLRLAFKATTSLGAERTFPMLRRAGDELVLVILPQPSFDYVKEKINLYLLIATIFTTTWAGAMWWASYSDSSVLETEWWWLRILITTDFLMGFLTFSLPLMAILGAHEMGHYYYAKKHNLEASLPFFLPMPPMIFPFGTMGAFISIREPIPNRKALLDVGASGPIAGLLVAIPVTLLGFWLTENNAVPVPVDSGDSLYLGSSFFFDALYEIGEMFYPSSGDYLSHPVVLAGWTGFFVTALNLMPAGQLDGGHIARALLGPKANGLSYTVIFLLIIMTFYGIPGFGPPFSGWAIYAILIFFLGTSHPPPSEELSSLDNSRIGVGALTGLILLTTFTPSPIFTVESPFSLDIDVDQTAFAPVLNQTNQTSFRILNDGGIEAWENVSVKTSTLDNFTIDLRVDYLNSSDLESELIPTSPEFSKYVYEDDSNFTFNLTSKSYVNLTISVTMTSEVEPGDYNFDIKMISRTERVYTTTFSLTVKENS